MGPLTTARWRRAARLDARRRELTQQVPELVVQFTRVGFLVLLWLFVFAALRVVRSDLYAASGLRVNLPSLRRGDKERKPLRGGRNCPVNSW